MEKGGGRVLPGSLIVVEDGTEYVDRFRRFLGAGLRFLRAGCFAEALALLEQERENARGLLLDQDFRRTAPELLVDERGESSPEALAEIQGILILRALRSRGVALPALLFADLDDDARTQRLERELGPLSVIPSTEGLAQIARRLERLATG